MRRIKESLEQFVSSKIIHRQKEIDQLFRRYNLDQLSKTDETVNELKLMVVRLQMDLESIENTIKKTNPLGY